MNIIKGIQRRLSPYFKKQAISSKSSKCIQFHIDEFSLQRIAGWLCRQQGNEFIDCEITVLLNGQVIQNTEINIQRADLKNAGFGNGRHGFNVAVNWQKFEVGKNILELKVDDTSKAVIELVVTQKEMMVAMTQQINTHIDTSFSRLRDQLTDEFARNRTAAFNHLKR
ncbi:hypothetical protein [Paraglaciecola sp. L3A3]|uniref:hypothetical protein n=1 Tax=Paraglaciecola sp. L3A3 TaxID=2686358 RepID=UPI00131D30C4|nr:hypothetical protein [Paraglaciecola sp. L3A3]